MHRDRLKQLSVLQGVTGASLEAAQASLRQAIGRRQDIEDRLRDLDGRHGSAMSTDADSPARLCGADMRWLRWVENRRAELNRDLAQARVSEEQARRAAAKAFGRDQALAALVQKARSQRR